MNTPAFCLFKLIKQLSKKFKAFTQGCCLTGAWLPGAPWLRAWATKALYKEPEQVPNFVTKVIDPNFLVNYIPVAGHDTVKVLMYLVSVSTWECAQIAK